VRPGDFVWPAAAWQDPAAWDVSPAFNVHLNERRACLSRGRGREHTAVVPRQAFELFLEVLGQLANGNAVTILPVRAELTTQQAADLLNVSRPHLVEILERGEIPFRRVGSHRRIAAADVLAYRKRDEARRRALMDELTAEAQKMGVGY
jgi:excisionase family DNA binding protein